VRKVNTVENRTAQKMRLRRDDLHNFFGRKTSVAEDQSGTYEILPWGWEFLPSGPE
jgi:hypothetical protein